MLNNSVRLGSGSMSTLLMQKRIGTYRVSELPDAIPEPSIFQTGIPELEAAVGNSSLKASLIDMQRPLSCSAPTSNMK